MKFNSFYIVCRIFFLSSVLAGEDALAFSSTPHKNSKRHGKPPSSDAMNLAKFNRGGVIVKSAAVRMSSMRSTFARLPKTISVVLQQETADPRVQVSSIPAELPVPLQERMFPNFNGKAAAVNALAPPSRPVIASPTKVTNTQQKKKAAVTKLDVALFATYFCNMAVMNLSVLTVPALAAEHLTSPHAIATFVAGVTGLSALGGGFGKIINGFVCQSLGGRRSSWIYLLGVALLSLGMAASTSLRPIGMILVGYEFLSSIQWVAICQILSQHYSAKPELMARGIAILSLSSTCGALAAKTMGAALLKATNWRTVTQFGAVLALVGAAAVYTGSTELAAPPKRHRQQPSENNMEGKKESPISVLKSILGNKVFWMIGIGHSLGFLARGSDRLLGAFLFEVSSLPLHICASLTSSVTIGFVFGLLKGKVFSKLESVQEKMSMLKKNYMRSCLCLLGLALCGIKGMTNTGILSNNVMAGLVALISGIMASTISFQFYQIPNMVSSTVFSENSSVSLSLIDAAGFFVTAQVLGVNTQILSKLGWSASWTFLAMIFAFGGGLMMKGIEPILSETHQKQQHAS